MWQKSMFQEYADLFNGLKNLSTIQMEPFQMLSGETSNALENQHGTPKIWFDGEFPFNWVFKTWCLNWGSLEVEVFISDPKETGRKIPLVCLSSTENIEDHHIYSLYYIYIQMKSKAVPSHTRNSKMDLRHPPAENKKRSRPFNT